MPQDRQKRGHYLFTVKDNQPGLRQDIADVWDLTPLPPPHVIQTNKHGGRVERRSLWVSNALVGYSDWPHLAQVCRLERVVTCKRYTRWEVAYAVTSLSPQSFLGRTSRLTPRGSLRSCGGTGALRIAPTGYGM